VSAAGDLTQDIALGRAMLLDVFGDIPEASYLCLGTYYPAQFLLAFSLFVYACIDSSNKLEG